MQNKCAFYFITYLTNKLMPMHFATKINKIQILQIYTLIGSFNIIDPFIIQNPLNFHKYKFNEYYYFFEFTSNAHRGFESF